MQFGVNILNFGPGANRQDLLGWAQTAERLGYHSVMISDHVAITPSVATRYPEPFFDTFITLSWLAGQTTRIRLGNTIVVLPYRHPVLIAREGANLDHLSGGRFIFGVGVGNPEDEFAALNVNHSRRGRIATETLEAVLALWQGEGFVDYHGRYIKFEQVSAIKTEQQPRPPVWVGGTSEAALRRAVALGDGWHPFIRAAGWQDGLDQLGRVAREMGRPRPAFVPRITFEITDAPVDGVRIPGVGSIEQVASDLRELEAAGAEHVTLDWNRGDLEATKNHGRGWHMLARLAEQIADLEHEKLR